MSLTAFQRYRRMKQVEEMKPENIMKESEKPVEAPVEEPVEKEAEEVENFTDAPLVPDETENEESKEEPVEEEKPAEETKTDRRRKNNK